MPAALERRHTLGRHYPVDPHTAQRVARHLAAAADFRTGRQARPTVDGLAAAAQLSERQTQRVLKLLEALHLVVRVIEGRSVMTRTERLWAWRNGSSHRAIAAEFALVVPLALTRVVHRWRPPGGDGVTPPGEAVSEGVKSPRSASLHERKDRRKSRAAPGTHRRSREPATTPATARLRRLIAELQRSVTWLSAVSPRRLTCLHRFAAHGWSGRDVERAVGDVLRARGWSIPDEIKNPPAYLANLLRNVDPADRLDVDELVPDRSVQQWRNELARWDHDERYGAECRHGQPGGEQTHPIRGHVRCPLCRIEERA